MPATLGHIAVQIPLGRALQPRLDVKWMLAACVIPDLPWILQRAVAASGLVPALDLRAYAVAQSSLVLCLAFCVALAAFARAFWPVLLCLGLGCLMHLLLDPMEEKWANGVVLLAPVRWSLTGFALFWPEDLPVTLLLAAGALVAAWMVWKLRPSGADLVRPGPGRLALAAAGLAVWLAWPLALRHEVEAANLHDIATLRAVAARPGRPVAFDRNPVTVDAEGARIRIWTGETLRLTGAVPPTSGVYSVAGRFTDPGAVEVAGFHRHAGRRRDIVSYIGLGFIAAWWGASLLAPLGSARAGRARGRGG